ncbi:MAG: hypothetical protein DRJ50_09045 [Actinobacteria bacterium]|nr:MAG: hypothetical protein DRJ50_09045 [Actinomycetota bacterium]
MREQADRVEDVVIDGQWFYLHETTGLTLRGRELSFGERLRSAWLLLTGGHLEMSAWFGIGGSEALYLDDVRVEVKK